MRTQRHISAWLVALVIACTPAGTEPASEATTTSSQSLSQSLPQVVAGPFQCSNGAPRSYSSTSYRDGLDWPMSFSPFLFPLGQA
jgi:hypothetical protein